MERASNYAESEKWFQSVKFKLFGWPEPILVKIEHPDTVCVQCGGELKRVETSRLDLGESAEVRCICSQC